MPERIILTIISVEKGRWEGEGGKGKGSHQ